MRLLCIDYGDRRTGIATCDPIMFKSYGLETIVIKKEVTSQKTIDSIILKRLDQILEEYPDVEIIVLGMPYNENGTDSQRTEVTKEFFKKLQCKYNNLKIDIQDERYTSIQALDILNVSGAKKKKKKGVLDQVAASCILDSYIQEHNIGKE